MAEAINFEILSMDVLNPPIVNGETEQVATCTIQAGPFLFSGAKILRWRTTRVEKLVLPGVHRSCRAVITDRYFRESLTYCALKTWRDKIAVPPLAKAPPQMEPSSP